MCGLSGIYAFTGVPILPAEISAQIDTLVHRGPNQAGVYISPGGTCGLGIRRLSIIDVAGGRQPLSSPDKQTHLVYNGEIYNHTKLRPELIRLSHQPQTGSDGEAILHGYRAWGPEAMLQRLRGMFALALWDESRRQLLLARDRFGIKPLYYAEHQGRLYFASEIKAILSDARFPRRVNVTALQALLEVGFVPGPATLFDGIFKLPAAHFLLARPDQWHIKRYWNLTWHPTPPRPTAELLEQFLALLDESVRLRLMSEVPLGALLSGGLDSGALVALAQAYSERQLKTISIGFDQSAYDESVPARALADFIGTEHHPVNFSPQNFDDFPHIMRHLEEPFCSATAVPIYRLYQACRQAGLTVALTGEGADELLGGYHWHRGDALVRRLLPLPAPLRHWLTGLPVPMSAAARQTLVGGCKNHAERYRHWLTVPGGGLKTNLLTADIQAGLSPAPENPLLTAWPKLLAGVDGAAPLHQMLWLEAQTRLVDFINVEVDKMSMAHSIEARVPFLDHRLWEFCAGLPPRLKIHRHTEKYLLRQAARGLLPEATRRRRKKGLAAPYHHWLRANRLPDWAETALSSAALQQTGLFQPEQVQTLRLAHQHGQPNRGALLMGILSVQVWFETFIK
jgi:asparagine synthase (glutamine-hydrolysing)